MNETDQVPAGIDRYDSDTLLSLSSLNAFYSLVATSLLSVWLLSVWLLSFWFRPRSLGPSEFLDLLVLASCTTTIFASLLDKESLVLASSLLSSTLMFTLWISQLVRKFFLSVISTDKYEEKLLQFHSLHISLHHKNDGSTTLKYLEPEDKDIRRSRRWTISRARSDSDTSELELKPAPDAIQAHMWSDFVESMKWFGSKIALSTYRSQSPAASGAQGTTSGTHSNRENGTAGSQPPPKRKLTKKDCGSVARVKEHVYRCHQLPENKCNRCCQVFSSALELSMHQRDINPCDIRVEEVREGIDANTKAQLRSKKRGPKMTEAERWLAMYRILFPNASSLPDPYYIHLNSQLDSLEEYSQYLQRELPRLVRQELQVNIWDPDLICDRISHALAESLSPQLYHAFLEVREYTGSCSPAEIVTRAPEIDTRMQEATRNQSTDLASPFERLADIQEDFSQIQPSFSFDNLRELIEIEDGAKFTNTPLHDPLELGSEFAGSDFGDLADLPTYDQTTKAKTDSGYDTSEQTC